MSFDKRMLRLSIAISMAVVLIAVALPAFAAPACAADIPVSGTVTDVSGQSVPGIEVRIFVKYADQSDFEGVTGAGTGHEASDAGKYSVTVPGVDLSRSPTIKAQARYIDQTRPDGQNYFAETTAMLSSDAPLVMDIHYTTAFPKREEQFILDGTIYVDEVPTNGITVTATLNGNSKTDVTGSSGRAGYYRIVFEPNPGKVTISYTFNGETQTMEIPYDDRSIGGSSADFHISTASAQVPVTFYAIAGHVYFDGMLVNGATVSTDYNGGASNTTFKADEYGNGLYLLLLEKGNGPANVSATYNGITLTKTIVSPNLTEGGYDMLDFYLTTPGASQPASATPTPGPTQKPIDLSQLVGSENTPTPVPSGSASPSSGPGATPGQKPVPSVLLSGMGTIAILSLVCIMARKRQ